jgi:rod shape-determining protein MreC
METLISRYRSLTVLLVVVFAQLVYLAYQVKTNRDERLIRVWAVTAVTPMAGVVEAIRHNTIGFLQDYFILLDVREQDRKLKSLNDQLRLENIYLRNQLSTAENGRALLAFQAQSRSRTVAARVIGNSTVATAKAVFVDRGSTSGIENGMPVVTPEGIVGKVTAVYPLVSQVLLVTDPTFKVGVESQKGHVHGVLDCGNGSCTVEQIQNEDRIDAGEWFFTSGEDRVFPKGFPVGTVVSVQPGQGMKDVKINLSGSPGGVEEVLVVLKGVHQQIPTQPVAQAQQTTQNFMAPPASDNAGGAANPATKSQTEADKVLQQYNAFGKSSGHVYGSFGSSLPNFNSKTAPGAPQAASGTPGQSGTNPANPATPGQTTPTTPAAANKPPAPAKPVPAPVPPALLGARPGRDIPQTQQQPAPKPVAPKPQTDTSPTYLGAPRRKPAPANDGQANKPSPSPASSPDR